MDDLLTRLPLIILPVVLAVTFHEAAHAYVAWHLGDDTAYKRGRVTLNPIRHIDPLGTIVLPTLIYLSTHMVFGWAKPVPVSFRRLNRPRRDMVLVALAGPLANILLALVSVWLLRWVSLVPGEATPWIAEMLSWSLSINLLLAVFNMMPLPPLDGGRVLLGLLPGRLAVPFARLEKYGFLILLGALFLLPMIGTQLGLDLNLFARIVLVPTAWLRDLLTSLAGLG